MKIALPLSLVAAVLSTGDAFSIVGSQQQQRSCTELAAASRKDFLSTAASATLGLVLSSTAMPSPALAAKYGDIGRGSPEVLDPAAAEVDMDVLKSGPVQQALGQIKDYQSAVRTMQDALAKDSQANVHGVVVREFDFSKLRATLNTFNTAFDEDTQRGTDRLIRAIMQDITELDVANTQKEGISRSERRLETMKRKLSKLDQAFSDLLAFNK